MKTAAWATESLTFPALSEASATEADAAPQEPSMAQWPQALNDYLLQCRDQIGQTSALAISGRLTRVAGVVMQAAGLRLPLGASCSIEQGHQSLAEAEVVGFAGDQIYLMPCSEIHGLTPGAKVQINDPPHHPPEFGGPAVPRRRAQDRTKHLPVGIGLLGRVVDAAGRPLDSLGPLQDVSLMPLASRSINPIEREPIKRTLDVGVRAINALLTVGQGQRMGLFAGTGVGKSVLLGMMARHTEADITIVGLIGERGREVKEFIEQILGDEGIRRSVVVAAPADSPPLMRLQGASYATLVAEYFRARGAKVLLIMDSLTRYAMAQREIALAIGEPPATKGYPPSVFAKLPALVERAGNGRADEGSITAFYTVLSEGDDQQDPIADAARGILDGHIVLSRQLAESGHYPAIDLEQSISRVMHGITAHTHFDAARRLKALYSKYQRNADLINVGAYIPGSDPLVDRALALRQPMEDFLCQGMNEKADLADSVKQLYGLTVT